MGTADLILEAIKKNDVDMLNHLIDGDADWIQASLGEQVSFLIFSIYYSRAEATRIMLEKGHPINIFEAAALGDLEKVTDLLSKASQELNMFSKDGFQPLGLACFFGNVDVVKYLVALGAELNTPSRNAQMVTPLHSAAAADDFEIVKCLIDNGADVNVCQQGDFTPLHAAAQNGNLEMTHLLVDRGARVDARTSDGLTSLDLASKSGNVALIDYLKKTK